MQKTEQKYFETYEVQESDLDTLQDGVDLLAGSGLVEEGVLDDIRFVTYDARNLFVVTRGQHASTEEFAVEELPSKSADGFRVFKMAHPGIVGQNRDDYRGAYAWLLCEELETTAVGASKYPNENVILQPELPQPREILDVVRMTPYEPYIRIHQDDGFNYLTDVVFHEAGHIEHRRLEAWQEGEDEVQVFPSDRQKEEFLSVVHRNKIFSGWVTDIIIESIHKGTINEMYAMLIDREAAKRFDTKRFDEDNNAFKKALDDIPESDRDEAGVERLKKWLESGHTTGRWLIRVLEDEFPGFDDRKEFVRSIFDRSSVA
ncbi:MAG: hypothetical protein H6799_01955 [Candidatus Nomurabacteria bacterium]|nr:MAG: hypothetical protein H6799_01955 [Candidatus Nomurabacteria bacterium]HRV75997.1 hypothetical protein [Candidatus Saccharimonadales bacterium]